MTGIRDLFDDLIETTFPARLIKGTGNILRQLDRIILLVQIGSHRYVRQGSYVAKVSITNHDGL